MHTFRALSPSLSRSLSLPSLFPPFLSLPGSAPLPSPLPLPFFLWVAWRPLQFGLFCTLWLVFASFLSMVPFPSSCSVTLLLVILSGLLLWGWFLFRFFRFSLNSFIVFGSPVAWICAYSAVFSVFNRSFNRIGVRNVFTYLLVLFNPYEKPVFGQLSASEIGCVLRALIGRKKHTSTQPQLLGQNVPLRCRSAHFGP